MKQHQRNRTIDDLRRGRIRLLIATDVAARGIDISDITQVINLDLPKIAEDTCTVSAAPAGPAPPAPPTRSLPGTIGSRSRRSRTISASR